MRIRITLLLVLTGIILTTCALLPINWEFVDEQFDPLSHMLGGGVSTAMFGLALYYLRKSRLCVRFRAVYAFVLALAVWSSIEIVQTRIPHHGPEMSDLIADIEGVNLGLIVFLILEWVIKRSESNKIKS